MSGGAGSEPPAKVPVTIITGFLGAGKTTLLNRILSENHGMKIAVIENEFGEIGIDDMLVKKKFQTDEEIFEMNNGCVCCTVRGDLIRIVTKILSKKDKFDAIVIETTGMADPAPVAQTFFQDENIKMKCSIDSILTVVDAKHVMLHMDAEMKDGAVNEAVQQVAFADIMLLNKCDLVSQEELLNVEKRCRDLNSTCQMIRCTNAQVDIAKIMGLKAFSLERIADMDIDLIDADAGHGHGHSHGDGTHCDTDECTHESHGHGHGHDEGHGHGHEEEGHGHGHGHEEEGHGHGHGHDEGHGHGHEEEEGHAHGHGHSHGSRDAHWDDRVSSVGIQEDGALDLGKLNQWFGTLLRDKGVDIYRMKGVLNIAGQDEKFVFQGVHMVFDGQPMEPWGPDEKRFNRLVFIGKELNRQELEDAFKLCMSQTQ